MSRAATAKTTARCCSMPSTIRRASAWITKKADSDNALYLVHHFEHKPLIKDFITNTLMGIEYLWGGPVELETHEPLPKSGASRTAPRPPAKAIEPPIQWQRVVYTMKERKLSRRIAA